MDKKEKKSFAVISSAIALGAGLYLSRSSIRNIIESSAFKKDAARTVNNVQKAVKATKEPIKKFGGLTINEIKKTAEKIHRFHDIKIDGNDLILLYKSKSGKTVNKTRFNLGKNGKLTGIGPYPTASVPRVFAEKLQEMFIDKGDIV